MTYHTIGLVGAGFMGGSLARAIHRALPEARFGIVEVDSAKRTAALQEFDADDFSASVATLTEWADLLVLAVKPYDLERVAEQLGAVEDRCLVLSVLAGVPIARLTQTLRAVRIVRIMPNLAAEIGASPVGLTPAPEVDEGEIEALSTILAAAGPVIRVAEDKLHAIVGVSGSGIAFALEFLDALAMGGVEAGISYHDALRAAATVIASAGRLVEQKRIHPRELVSRVCSPGGTTIAGVAALADGAFHAAVMGAVRSAAMRSREMER